MQRRVVGLAGGREGCSLWRHGRRTKFAVAQPAPEPIRGCLSTTAARQRRRPPAVRTLTSSKARKAGTTGSLSSWHWVTLRTPATPVRNRSEDWARRCHCEYGNDERSRCPLALSAVGRPGLRAALRDGHDVAGLPGDQVELVAFDVGEGRPPELVSPDVASLWAPRLSRRSVSASKVSLMTSRCRRFLTVFGSGTLLNVIRGPLASPSARSRTACSEVESPATWRPKTSAQNRARAAASAQSKVTANSELLKVGVPFARRRLCERSAARILRHSCRADGVRCRCGRRRRR